MEIKIIDLAYADDGLASMYISKHNGLLSFIATVKNKVIKQQYQGYTEDEARIAFSNLCKSNR